MTSEVYTRGLLLRVRELDDSVQAWAWLEPAHAIERAREADQRVRAGRTPGALHGLPIGVKDLIATCGDAVRDGLAHL